ncbi:FxLYD domain-containing protein [Actinacidiphila glaucinigra]|uniref:FxLYD domain-containing protein n=1 Tax=Actinacidiphila glaucinigra TaxID=235986 RepID=UPI0033BB2D6C
MSQSSHASPPGHYPPHQEPDWSRPPKKRGAGKVVGFGVVAIVVIIGGSVAFALKTGEDKSGSGNDSPASVSPAGGSGQKSAPRDAKVTSCALAAFSKWPSAEVTITNHSSETSDYQVRIAFVDAGGGRIAEAVANATGLASGDAIDTSAQGSEPASGDIDCKVIEVLRKAS